MDLFASTKGAIHIPSPAPTRTMAHHRWRNALVCVVVLSAMVPTIKAQCPDGQEPAPPCGPTPEPSTTLAIWDDMSPGGLAPKPQERDGQGVAASADGKLLYVFGGKTLADGTLLNSLEVFDIDSGTWTEIVPTGQVPDPRYDMGMAYLNGKLFVFGGMGSGYILLDDFWVFDIATSTWTAVPVPSTSLAPGARFASAMYGLGNSVYLFGGQISAPPTTEFTVDAQGSSFYEFDTATSQWVDPYAGSAGASGEPAPRSASVMTALGSELIMFGGWKQRCTTSPCSNLSPNTVNEFDDLQKFDPVSKTWALLPNNGGNGTAPSVRHNSGLTVYEDKVYVMGGNFGHAGSNFGLYYYELSSGEWWVSAGDADAPYKASWPAVANHHLSTYGDAIYVVGSYLAQGTSGYPPARRGHMEVFRLDMSCALCVDIIEQTTAPLPEDPATTPLPLTTPGPVDALSVVEALNAAHLCCVDSVRLRVKLETLLVNALTAYEAGENALAVRLLRWFVLTASSAECPLSPCLNNSLAVVLEIGRQMTVETLDAPDSPDTDPIELLHRGDELAAAGETEAALLAYSAKEGSVGLSKAPQNGVCKQRDGGFVVCATPEEWKRFAKRGGGERGVKLIAISIDDARNK